MTAEESTRRFRPQPRKVAENRTSNDTKNLRTELDRILRRTEIVAAGGRSAFAEGQPNYDVASMVIIRLASILERSEYRDSTELLTAAEASAIRATLNIVAHAGYGSMNDELFWNAVTIQVPVIIRRLMDGSSR